MRFIEYYSPNPRGARICRTTFNHAVLNLKFTLYPMIHIGSLEFYKRLSNDLKRFDCILYEGTTWRKYRSKSPLYDLAAKNLGLSTQSQNLVFPKNVEKINIDMPAEEFRKRYKKVFLKDKLLLVFLRPILGFFTLVLPKGQILKAIIKREAPDEESLNKKRSKMNLIVSQRDEYVCGQLEHFVNEHVSTEKTKYVAVIFGLGHMYMIAACLRKKNFRVATKKWIQLVTAEDWTKQNWLFKIRNA